MWRLVPLAIALIWAAGAQAATVPGFRSPSGNISCAALSRPAMLFCTITESRYAQRLQARCMTRTGLDWHGFELGAARKGAVTCSGGLLVPGKVLYRTVPYGSTWRRGPFRCASARTGVRCHDAARHGLFS